MKTTTYSYLWFFSFWLLVLTGCNRREVLDEYPVSGVQISLDWKGVTGQLPTEMRAIFYPKSAGGVKFDSPLSTNGGTMKVIPGRYSVVIYNSDTETMRVCGEDSYKTIALYTGHCNGLGIPGTDQMVWEPDPIYVVSVEEVEIEKSDEIIHLVYQPKQIVKSYSFQMKVEGLEYVANVAGSVEGMANSYCLGTGVKVSKGGPVFFYMHKTSEGVSGTFRVFGVSDVAARAEFKLTLIIAFIKTDNSIQKKSVDITEVMASIKPPEGGGSEVEPPEIELPLEEEPIEIEKPTNPNPPSGGGIGGNVDDWEDEEEVVLPVK